MAVVFFLNVIFEAILVKKIVNAKYWRCILHVFLIFFGR